MTFPLRIALLGVAAAAITVAASSPVAPAAEVEMVVPGGEAANYWPRWRGPSGQGHVTGTGYVDTWSSTENIRWRATVPGVGHSSPIVWADHIFLTTGSEDGRRLSMLAYHRETGAKRWETVVPTTDVEHVYWKNTRTSSTPVTDGRYVWASFGTNGIAAFDFEGNLVWHTKPGDLANNHGSAGSLVLYKDRLFIYQDHSGTSTLGSYVGAFDAMTGETLWMTERAQNVGWGTPIVVRVDDHDELIVSSQRRVQAYNPDTGEELWQVRGLTFEVIPTPVVGHGLVFASSGRAGPTLAIRPGGSGDVTETHVSWQSPKGSPFVPSGIIHGELLYLINDMQSILTVFHAATGELAYQARLGEAVREGFSSSPVAVGDKLFFTNDNGQTFVVRAGPEFELLHVNELGAQVIASPALVGGTWYWRTDTELLAIETWSGDDGAGKTPGGAS